MRATTFDELIREYNVARRNALPRIDVPPGSTGRAWDRNPDTNDDPVLVRMFADIVNNPMRLQGCQVKSLCNTNRSATNWDLAGQHAIVRAAQLNQQFPNITPLDTKPLCVLE